MRIEDYLDVQALREEIANGFISARQHPTLPLTIFNYTNQAQYRGHSATTAKCRGLIVDDHDDIVARPFEKFYNFGESQAPTFNDDDIVDVYDKADGSIIIVTKYKGELVVASRGSFESDQAIAAARVIRSNPQRGVTFDHTTTIMELVGPSNRIVLSYPEDILIYLGEVHNESGSFYFDQNFSEDYRPVEYFGWMPFKDAIALPHRPDSEGYVIRGDAGVVKVKRPEYVEQHKIIFGLTYKGLIEMFENDTFAEFMDRVPDELFKQVDDMRNELVWKHGNHCDAAMEEYVDICNIEDQKEFALANTGQYRGECFALRADRPIGKTIWRRVKEEYKGR